MLDARRNALQIGAWALVVKGKAGVVLICDDAGLAFGAIDEGFERAQLPDQHRATCQWCVGCPADLWQRGHREHTGVYPAQNRKGDKSCS